MTNSIKTPPLADETGEDAETRRRWRRIGRLFSEIVERKVDDLDIHQQTEDPDKKKKGPGEDVRIRQISALVIAAQRSMEMQDRYDKKDGAEAPGESDCREKAARDLAAYEAELQRILDERRGSESVAYKTGESPCA